MSVLFVPKESVPGESRVALAPDSVKNLVGADAGVLVQRGAGSAAGFPEAAFQEAGAEIVDDAAAGYERADIVVRVQAPEPGGDEVSSLRSGTVLIAPLQPLVRTQLVRELASAGVTAFSLDMVPRISRAQKMDILSSQATAGGYLAVLLAATALPRFFPMLMTAAGTITPARVLVMGAGVAGLQAIATARRLGAKVEATDVRPEVREQVESLGAHFVDTGSLASTEGGYAREAKEEFLRRQQEILERHVSDADVVITTALVPGRKAPVLVTADMVEAMKPGSVIVDMAAGQGGNCELSKPDERVVEHGVTIIGETNLPSLLANDASRMFGRNLVAFLRPMLKEGAFEPDWEDEVVAGAVVMRDGEIANDQIREALQAQGEA